MVFMFFGLLMVVMLQSSTGEGIYCFSCESCESSTALLVQCQGYCYTDITISNGMSHKAANVFAKRYCGVTNATLIDKCHDDVFDKYIRRHCHCKTDYCNDNFLGVGNNSPKCTNTITSLVAMFCLARFFSLLIS